MGMPFFFLTSKKDRKPCAGDSVPQESDQQKQSWWNHWIPQQTGANSAARFPHFPRASQSRLLASPSHRVCQIPWMCVVWLGTAKEAPEAMQERGNLTAIQRRKKPRVNFHKGDKLGEAWQSPQFRPSSSPCQSARAHRHSVVLWQRPVRGRFRRCGPRCFAPLSFWPWLRIPTTVGFPTHP